MSAFKEYLKGKSVVLVGPASTLLGQGMGPWIDGHDVVVRINHAWPLPKHLARDVGTRTDILYHNLNPKKQRLRKKDIIAMHQSGVQWVVSTHPAVRARYRRRQQLLRRLSGRYVRFRAVPLSVKKRLRPHVGSANGGLIAIVDLLRYPIARLYVTGFSFYTTPYLDYPNYKRSFIKNALNHHNQRRHKTYLARLLKREPRLAVDPFIERLLRQHMTRLRKRRRRKRGRKR